MIGEVEVDKDVDDHIRSIREAGGVNHATVIATARGLVAKTQRYSTQRRCWTPSHRQNMGRIIPKKKRFL